MATYQKAPAAVLDYSVDWSDWLSSDTIASSQWLVPSGLTSGTESNTTTGATVWLSGGTMGKVYKVSNRITTNSSPQRISTRSFYIEIYRR